jgi:hypothetical protein
MIFVIEGARKVILRNVIIKLPPNVIFTQFHPGNHQMTPLNLPVNEIKGSFVCKKRRIAP